MNLSNTLSESTHVASAIRKNISRISERWETICRLSEASESNRPLCLQDTLIPALHELADVIEKTQALFHVKLIAAYSSSLEQLLFEFQVLREVLNQVLESQNALTLETRQTLHRYLDLGVRQNVLIYSEVQASRLKKAEAGAERTKQITNYLPMIVWTANPNGTVDWYNDWWYVYLGHSGTIHWDDPNENPMHPDDVPETWRVWKECLATGKLYQMEQRFRRGSDGQYRWHLVRGVPIRDESGKIVKWVGANMDIHDRKLAEEDLVKERVLRERFVETLTHDLRTPLTSAKMSAQFLNRKADHPDLVRALADRIDSSMDRADGMIRDLLDANRLKAGQGIPLTIRECRLDQVVDTTVSELAALHGPRYHVINPLGPIRGYWDGCGLRRVIENLAGNAIKYGACDKPIVITLHQELEWVTLAVHNEGPPIPHQDLDSLFNPYRRTHSASEGPQKGWGIGLTLVKGIIESHRGTAKVESSEGKGTTFLLRIPLDSRKSS